MKMRPRIYYTEEQKALMWDRWQRGESLKTIARAFETSHSAISKNGQEQTLRIYSFISFL